MRILLTNDDGVHAPGMNALAELLRVDHSVVIVAPDAERSGAGHSITLNAPLRVKRVSVPSDVTAYCVSGSPADCVKIACDYLEIEPELIVSGINHGYNTGIDTHYSGTVSAAAEGALHGIPSIAASMGAVNPSDCTKQAAIIAKLIPQLLKTGGRFFNINIPARPFEMLKGVRCTKLSSYAYQSEFIERNDPRGRSYLWMSVRDGKISNDDIDTDEKWITENYVTVTPLAVNATDIDMLKTLQSEIEFSL